NGWKNSTTVPKLTQIRDNLHANYLSALFPNEDWLRWEARTKDANTKKKRDAILAYIQNTSVESGLRKTASQLLYDFIDYGNAFAKFVYESRVKLDTESDLPVSVYTGPRVERIDPMS